MKKELTCKECGQRLTQFCKQFIICEEIFYMDMATVDILLQITENKVYCDTCGQEIKEDKNAK